MATKNKEPESVVDTDRTAADREVTREAARVGATDSRVVNDASRVNAGYVGQTVAGRVLVWDIKASKAKWVFPVDAREMTGEHPEEFSMEVPEGEDIPAPDHVPLSTAEQPKATSEVMSAVERTAGVSVSPAERVPVAPAKTGKKK